MFNIGDTVKLKDDLCPAEHLSNPEFQFGSLSYFVEMIPWELEVVKLFKHAHHGDVMELKVLNDPTILANVIFKVADCQEVINMKKPMFYELLSSTNKNQPEIDDLTDQEQKLVAERSVFKKQGVKVTDQRLIQNWSEVKSLRSKIKKLQESNEVIQVVKHNSGTYKLECKVDDIPKRLRMEIRKLRSSRKVVTPIVKTIAGDMKIEKLGGVMFKPETFLKLNDKFAMNLIKQHKKPTTSDNYVGIEIEMLSNSNIEDMNKAFIKARLHRYVNVGTDGSIRQDDENCYAMELRICLPENLLESKLQEICKVLRQHGCYANRSCGMHVHLDMRNRNPELAYKNFFNVQDILLSTQPEARRKNKYCRPNTDSSIKLKDFANYDRYAAINTASYYKNDMKTIEIRVHEGATKFKDIYNWAKFLVGVASLTTSIPKVSSVGDLSSLNFLDSSIVSHLEERVQEYSA